MQRTVRRHAQTAATLLAKRSYRRVEVRTGDGLHAGTA